MATPLPGTLSPTGNELTWQGQAQTVYNQLIKQGDTALAADWLAFYPGFHAANPSYSVQQVFDALVAEALGSGVGSGTAALGNVLGAVPAGVQAAANAVPSVTNPLDYLKDIGNTFDKLTDPHFWLRIGEFIAGGMLLYLGLKSTMSGTAIASGARQANTTANSGRKTIRKVAEAIAVVPK